MNHRLWTLLFVACVGLALPVDGETRYEDATSTNIPLNLENTMDAGMADVDGDGDLDVVLAMEWEGNRLLINDGTGVFTDESATRMPYTARDSEDAAIVDVDGDGDLDLVFVTEDDLVDELYLNRGDGSFSFGRDRFDEDGRSNAVATSDIDGDGDVDLVIGNNGLNRILLNDGSGRFFVDIDRLPERSAVTQDVELADVDGDGDLDLIEGNEDDNALLLNNGDGFFSYADGRIPLRESREETREVDAGDLDCDGDLDLVFANTNLYLPDSDPQNRLLINDGTGRFTDETARLPADDAPSFEVDLLDVDCDGDLDIITGNGLIFVANQAAKSTPRNLYRVFLNDGRGSFVDGTAQVFPKNIAGIGFDVAAGDVDGDGSEDLYLSGRDTRDRLLLSTARWECSRPVCPKPVVRDGGARVTP